MQNLLVVFEVFDELLQAQVNTELVINEFIKNFVQKLAQFI